MDKFDKRLSYTQRVRREKKRIKEQINDPEFSDRIDILTDGYYFEKTFTMNGGQKKQLKL